MKYAAAILLTLALAACSPSQDEHARAEARQTAEQARHDAKEALHKAEVETKRASKDLDADLHKAREKTRNALGEPDDGKSRP